MNIVKVVLDSTSHDIFLPNKRQEGTVLRLFFQAQKQQGSLKEILNAQNEMPFI